MARKLGPTEYYKTELRNAFEDENGFRYSHDRKRLFKAPGRLKEYVAPEGLEVICDRAFEGRVTYESIYLPDSVKYIGMSAFDGCRALHEINIPQGANVADSAFYGCDNLDQTMLPHQCEVGVADAQGCRYINHGKTLVKVPPQLINYTVQDGTEIIADRAFEKCKKCESVVLPRSIKKIGNYAFKDCVNLKKMNIPLSTRVAKNAFEGCEMYTPAMRIVIWGLIFCLCFLILVACDFLLFGSPIFPLKPLVRIIVGVIIIIPCYKALKWLYSIKY